ncbi:O-glucosyltransferase rumi homolog [Impatiens glandulifera]|uniref:O-glucosyltransferase rumi homolog n=1 Tax=Impatiens glandulifera TaxID=253017 RepID=UPI001FB087F3|nr:O-glucosyltransferase rumi homolog [Impatiens glandulifera]
MEKVDNEIDNQPNTTLDEARRLLPPWESSKTTKTPLMNTTMVAFIICFLFFGAFAFFHFKNDSNFLGYYSRKSSPSNLSPEYEVTYLPSLNCTRSEDDKKDYISVKRANRTYEIPSNMTCPNYFRWIHEDLRHWKKSGITKEMLNKAKEKANFRVIIIRGRLYIETYSKAFQSRDVFTIWGFIQLLRWYPGRIPDLDLMFNCDDPPAVGSSSMEYHNNGGPPPLFKYCSDKMSLDIVFPDWSFWGWAEVNIKPWKSLIKEMKQGNKVRNWEDRFPVSYWKGNSYVATTRRDLFNCNISNIHNSHALLYQQDWIKESQQGFKESNLANQCIHRYKIYIEGRAWSVSEKYIMACDSPTLYVDSSYYEFFSRSMFPMEHYWPINSNDKCKSLKFAVEWGNNHTSKAKEIGKEGSNYVMDQVKMEYVYDYMYHLLKEYANLLKFKPEVSVNATEMFPESMACTADGVWKEFMMESWETDPSERSPCSLSPRFSKKELKSLRLKRERSIKNVESMKNDYWKNRKW